MKSTFKLLAESAAARRPMRGFKNERSVATDIVVNYHGASPAMRSHFRAQLEHLSERFAIVDPSMLFESGPSCVEPKAGKPRLVLTFDDGLASHVEVVATVLDDLGIRGLAFLPAIFQDDRSASDAWTLGKALRLDVETERDLRRPNGTWNGWKSVAAVFDYGSHTVTHRRLDPGLTTDVARAEIVDSKSWIEDRLQMAVKSFAWVGGELNNYHASSLALAAEAGYERLFGTGHAVVDPSGPLIQRFHLDPTMAPHQIDARLSRLWSAIYLPKRHRIRRRLGQK